MDRRERKAILGEHGLYGDDPRDRSLGERLAGDLEGSPLRGKPLRQRLRNFRPGVDSYVLGLHGPPAYMGRLREIEQLTAEHEERLAARHRELAARCADRREFAYRWRRTAERWNFGAVNELIERHNRWYPAESRLPMNPRTGDFVLVGGHSYRRPLLDAAWVLERFPPARERGA